MNPTLISLTKEDMGDQGRHINTLNERGMKKQRLMSEG